MTTDTMNVKPIETPVGMLREIEALTREAELIAPAVAALSNRFAVFYLKLKEWENKLPEETLDEIGERGRTTGLVRLSALMHGDLDRVSRWAGYGLDTMGSLNLPDVAKPDRHDKETLRESLATALATAGKWRSLLEVEFGSALDTATAALDGRIIEEGD